MNQIKRREIDVYSTPRVGFWAVGLLSTLSVVLTFMRAGEDLLLHLLWVFLVITGSLATLVQVAKLDKHEKSDTDRATEAMALACNAAIAMAFFMIAGTMLF